MALPRRAKGSWVSVFRDSNKRVVNIVGARRGFGAGTGGVLGHVSWANGLWAELGSGSGSGSGSV